MELFTQQLSGAAAGSRTLAEAFVKQARVFDEPLFDNAAAYGCAIGVLVGTWFASYALSDGLWYLWTLNWQRLFAYCCCCFRRQDWRTHNDGDRHRNDDPFFRSPHDPNESANKPKVVPVGSGKLLVPLPPQRGVVMGDVVGVTPQSYATLPVVQSSRDSRLWSGAKRSRTENYVRLTVLLIRLLVLVAGVMLAFQAAGVNVLSLAASMGILSLCFSYGGANLLRNFLNVMYMHGTDKLAIGVYVKLDGQTKGVISAFRTQWTELTDDLSPLQGRQIHQIPNAVFMEGKVTVYPDGPPPEEVARYYDELNKVNEFRASRGRPPLAPLESVICM